MNFKDLLQKAASTTAQQQADFAKQEEQRLAAKKAAEEAEARKRAEQEKFAAERRREREERERKEREAAERKKAALPKTTNLWQLKQERKKLGLDPDGKDDHLLEGKAKGGAARNSTSSTGAAKDKGKAKEQAVVSRREDKARKRQDALFRDDEPSSGSFALAKLQQKTASKDEPPSRPTASTASRPTASSSASSVAKPKPVAGKPVAALSRSPSTSAVGGSVRDRLKAGFSDAPQKLNVIKRDNRTIEEIERDMKLRKAKEAASKNGGSALSTSISAAPAKSSKSASRSPAPARPPSNPKSARRARPATPSDEDDDDSDMSSSSTEHRKRKRSRYEKERGLNNAQRDAIWSLMGRNRSADVARERAFGSDDDSDMEATGADVLLEERRAARLAAKEDAEEQERLRRHAEEKKKRKIQASK